MEVLYQLSYPGGFGLLEPKICDWNLGRFGAMAPRWNTRLKLGVPTALMEPLPLCHHGAMLEAEAGCARRIGSLLAAIRQGWDRGHPRPARARSISATGSIRSARSSNSASSSE